MNHPNSDLDSDSTFSSDFNAAFEEVSSAQFPNPEPAAFRARYEDVVWHEGTHELDAESFESVRARAQRGWGVGALIVNEGSVLLVRQDSRWYAPGGMLEFDESPEEGAIREVREETGLTVQLDGLAAIAEQTFVNAANEETFLFYFAMFDALLETAVLTDDPGLSDENISAVEWHATVPIDTYDRPLIVELLQQQHPHWE
ncbi:NUDIX hydrolase [Halocatena marina]|uniref:NUDIX hydrolase n=1 Tax=Halocatena marina TaxID=2934937 RepID=UPI0022245F83|nr:NUDIX hydrolase [Halocatena marina]